MQIQAMSGAAYMQGAQMGQVGQGQRPPPPPKDGLSGFMDTAKDDPEIRDFLQSIREASDSGEFDAQALAEQAPDSLKSYAEENGIDLASMFQKKHDAHQERMASSEGGRQPIAGRFAQLQFSTSSEGILMSALQRSTGVETAA
ncbi:hypothetical protein P2G88_00705 [Aliiglaciecola sp. CAU 1673]|uniref:hypothetical protein n=1 Tax=Aliiglaciecola sp. CAU 1673 TaxID=3032595 RepID=UPI0023DB77C4|nr:hypothetical protein [Aliiglaciecola sp. CAU 1673]MDF2176768.1 hypothetical protein [Aliiglaciecola sp. CAU 1673]